MTAPPYHWVKQIEGSLEEMGHIPIWGKAPSFPWEKYAQILSQELEIPDLSLKIKNTEWKEGSALLEGMGRTPFHITLDMPPLSNHIHFLFTSEDVSHLIATTLTNEVLTKGFTDKGLIEGYFSYLATEAMAAVETAGVYPGLSLKLAPKSPLPKEGAWSIDIEVTVNNKSLWGRLICPTPFLHSFRRYFHTQPRPPFSRETRQKIELFLNLRLGTTHLSLEELHEATVGDVIVLDRCQVDPQTGQGTLKIFLQDTPLFEAHISERNIKIVDYSNYHEEGSMAKDHIDDEDEEFDDELDEDLDDEEFDDDDFEDDEEFDDELDEDLDDEDIEEDEEIEDKTTEPQGEHPWTPPLEESPIAHSLQTGKIPVTLTVELGRVKMTLDKLLELKPGNVLKLETSVDQPLDIRLNGKKVAQGELVKIGDLLGMKILDIKTPRTP